MTGVSVLEGARSLLTRGGWVRGHVAVDERSEPCSALSAAAVAFSLGGAIEAAAGGLNTTWQIAALYLLDIWREADLESSVPPNIRIECASCDPCLFDWEEHVASFDDVLFVLDRAIADARVNA